MTDGHERRQLERQVVDVRVEIDNRLTGERVGGLVNIHSEGLLIAAETPLAVDSVFQLLLRPCDTAKGIGEFELGVDCLWVRAMSQEQGWWVGCRIISATPDAVERVERITSLIE